MKSTKKKIFLNYNDIEKFANDLAREILLSDWRPDYIVGITRGGLLPAVLLSQYLKVPMNSLDVSLRDGSELGPESNTWMAEDAFGYVASQERDEPKDYSSAVLRKNILIVDDINDTGETLAWIQHDWSSGCLPASDAWDEIWGKNVRTAVVVNNESSEWDHVDYFGLEINKAVNDKWVVFPTEDWWQPKPQ